MYKYDVVKNWIKERAQDSVKAGKIPSVREIASTLSVSVATVLRALTDLEHEKVLQRRQGAGMIALHPESLEASNKSVSDSEIPKVLVASLEYVIDGIFRMALGIEQCLRRHGATSVNYRIKPATTLDDIVDYAQNSPIVFSGMIICGFNEKITEENLEKIGKLPFRVVFLDIPQINLHGVPENCLLVSSDPASGVEIAADYFVSCGHTRIGYLRNEPYGDYLKSQIDAFGKALHARGVNFNREYVFSKSVHFWENSMETAQSIIKENIDKLRRMKITALFVSSSLGACAVVEPLRQAGFDVPGDISIIGEGDTDFCKYMSPPITIVASDWLESCTTAVDFLFGSVLSQSSVFFKLHLLERRSVATLV